ncbi:MAG TPA: branched-chain amino acid ABC transporter substrate-binding protein [Actinomycetes bacterium]|nr:branched-chain amino acid ABC transporter substrate-binding protein [Actinomycetes bacterium]
MRRSRWAGVLVAAIALLVAGCGDSSNSSSGGQAASCKGSVGVMGPFTGDAASIGQEQLNWAKFAVERFNAENKTSYAMVEGDTQLDPAQASTVAQQFLSNSAILGVVGPAGSQEVEAVGPIYTRANLGFVSGSATKTELTDGSRPTFFRVVSRDDVQGPQDARYMIDNLSAKAVMIIDDQTSYSTGLADAAEQTLKAGGVTTSRESVNQKQSDFSALVSKVAADTDVVFLPWQLAAKAQVFSQQLSEQGRKAVIFGSDGLFAPEDFKAEGSYVSAFAPDIKGIPEDADLVSAYNAKYGEFGTFGPPTYAATQVVLTAMNEACKAGNLDRKTVVDKLKTTNIDDSILGGTLKFDAKGDVDGGKFYIFRIQGGKYNLVTE